MDEVVGQNTTGGEFVSSIGTIDIKSQLGDDASNREP